MNTWWKDENVLVLVGLVVVMRVVLAVLDTPPWLADLDVVVAVFAGGWILRE